MLGGLESQPTGKVWHQMFTHLRPTHLGSVALAMVVDRSGCLETPEARIPRVITPTTMQAVRIIVAAMGGITDLNMTMFNQRIEPMTSSAVSQRLERLRAALPLMS